MAETHLRPGSTTAQQPAGRFMATGWLLGALEWSLLLAALGVWAGSRAYTPAMSVGSGLLVGSWLLRWARTGRVTRATPLDLALGLFMLSVLAGLWAAPQLGVALPRLYLFLGALGVYYALANSRGQELRLAALGLVLVAASAGLYFASQHNWAQAGAKFDTVGQVGLWLNRLVPDLGLYKPHPNVVAGLLGVAAPVALALTLEGAASWRMTRAASAAVRGTLAGLGWLVILLGVVVTESRAVWVALAAALGLAAWWWVARRVTRQRPGMAWPLGVFWAGLGLGAAAVAVALTSQPQLLTRVLGSLPGPTNTAINRLELFAQVWRLGQDTALTGGGLGAFPALYATYILDIPVLLLTHAHNAYLNLLVEQGWLGLAAYALILAGAAWAATRALAQPAGTGDSATQALLGAGAAGVAVVLVQGLGDGTLVASRAIPFLFVPAGLVIAAAPTAAAAAPDKRRRGVALALLTAAGVTALALLFSARRPLQAAWQANLGAVQYARIELAGWPTGEWKDSSLASTLAAANPHFEQALALDGRNRTALYRLGLQARVARDFERAAALLAPAYADDPGHRGLAKVLGYTRVWLGDFEAAETLLAQVPEASEELDVYAWWWQTQGREDLAEKARRMSRQLAP